MWVEPLPCGAAWWRPWCGRSGPPPPPPAQAPRPSANANDGTVSYLFSFILAFLAARFTKTTLLKKEYQCCRSMKFLFGSESADPYFSRIRIQILLFSSVTFKTLIFSKTFWLLPYFLKVHLHHFSKIKSHKKSQNSRNQCLSYCFCLMREESGSGRGSISLTNGSGSGRPKNIWILRIRIHNTGWYIVMLNSFLVEKHLSSTINEKSVLILFTMYLRQNWCFK